MTKHPTISGLRGLTKRVGELAEQVARARLAAQGLAVRAEARRIIADPQALEASIALFEWLCDKMGVDEYPPRPGQPWPPAPGQIAAWLEGDAAGRDLIERRLPALQQAEAAHA